MSKQNLPHHPVQFEYNGTLYHGTYTVDDDLVTVFFGMATKSDTYSRYQQPAEALATLLLSELVTEQKKGF